MKRDNRQMNILKTRKIKAIQNYLDRAMKLSLIKKMTSFRYLLLEYLMILK